MELSASERILFLTLSLSVAYRYVKGKWPIGLEVEEVEQ